jgi:hypothetical protein
MNPVETLKRLRGCVELKEKIRSLGLWIECGI